MGVYFGDLNQKLLQRHRGLVDDEKTEGIIAQFLDLSRQYPARTIEDSGRVPEELLEKLKAINFFGLNIPAIYGGLGLRLLQYLKVAQVVATSNMDLGFTALAHLSIGVKGLVLFGTEEQKQKYLPKALKVARGHARQVRTLMNLGVLFFGRSIVQKQFLLRRITYLSIYLFGLLAALAQIESKRKRGQDCQKEIYLLAFFTEEARLFRKHDSNLFATRKERLHKRIVGMLLR
jgi:alkylation response protein AidB-like acyl-CoA dehydrogenase